MKGLKSNMKKRFIWIMGVSFLLLIIYPCVIWMNMGYCTTKIGSTNNEIVASYSSIMDSTKKIHVFRYISTEYFKYPFLNKKEFEFYTIQPENQELVARFKVGEREFKYYKWVHRKNIDDIPEIIQAISSNELEWEEYQIFFRDESQIEHPEPSILEMLQYGPTLTHRNGICN